MNHYRENYKEEGQNEQKEIYEFNEYPQVKEYYSNKIATNVTKPKKIIVTEIFDSTPQTKYQSRNLNKNKEYYKNYTGSSSPLNYNFQNNKNSYYSNNLNERYSNTYLTQYNDDFSYNMRGGTYSNYNNKIISNLREEYSMPTNDRVNIRKKIYRGSHTPNPYNRNNFNINNLIKNEENNNEELVENFQYYESRNIKDMSNKIYKSITRVTGYSNLIPLHKRRLFFNENNLNRSYNFDSPNIYK